VPIPTTPQQTHTTYTTTTQSITFENVRKKRELREFVLQKDENPVFLFLPGLDENHKIKVSFH
jgi:hypothetical protein